jgi:hypothetical protein
LKNGPLEVPPRINRQGTAIWEGIACSGLIFAGEPWAFKLGLCGHWR